MGSPAGLKMKEKTMKLCDKNCIPICNHCAMFKFNYDNPDNSWCALHREVQDPCGKCDDFECALLYREVPEKE